MKVLVTGGAGFIGSHVVERLLQLDKHVFVIDDMNDFYSPVLKEANLATARKNARLRFYRCDICDPEAVSGIVQEHRPEAIIHLAARAGVRPSLANPLLYESVNVHGTLVLLEAARNAGVERFVFASSSSVYGITNRLPFREDDCVNRPISPYAATKVAGENTCYVYSHLYGMKVICLRLFTVYGPRQRPDLAIRKFTEMITRGMPIPVFGDGSSMRDYTYIDDIVDGIMAALRCDSHYEIVNLGNASPIRLTAVIDTIQSCLGKRAIIRSLPEQPGDVPITYADVGKAESLFGYKPQTPFSDGVRKFMAWYLEHSVGAG